MSNDLREEVLSVLAERFGVDRATVTDESRLREELDLDSIDLFDVLGLVEKKTGAELALADFANVETLGDFLARLEMIVSKAA